ncbi:hypothetical protein B0H34DRAFT_808438 [Crassisporium funariophilum]|nr:hypothetical protein B0H34DRAFT_808438 [Crassisporium funariophilum]
MEHHEQLTFIPVDPRASPLIERLELSRIDMSMRDKRYLQYFSDVKGLSEIDLSEVVGISDRKLVFGGRNFGSQVDKGSVMLINGHTLQAKVRGVETTLDLNKRIRSVDEVLKYSEAGYGVPGEICFCCSWTREIARRNHDQTGGGWGWWFFLVVVLVIGYAKFCKLKDL